MGLNLNKKKIYVSVIGAGYMAEEHIKAFKKFKRFKILGIISKNNLNAKKLASKYKIDYVWGIFNPIKEYGIEFVHTPILPRRTISLFSMADSISEFIKSARKLF